MCILGELRQAEEYVEEVLLMTEMFQFNRNKILHADYVVYVVFLLLLLLFSLD